MNSDDASTLSPTLLEARSAITKSYMICATQRSGSYLLCEALQRSHVASAPSEYFLPRGEPAWAERWSTNTFSEYYTACLRHATDENGVFGFKTHWAHLDTLIERLRQLLSMSEAPAARVLDAAFPHLRYIWIRRRDKVRQAISFHRANQSDVWWRSGAELPQELAVDFDYDAIDALVRACNEDDAAWEAFFRSNGIQPYVVIYEDFVANQESVARDILRFLALPVTAAEQFGPRQLQKQADEISEEWVKRYNFIKQQRERASHRSFVSRMKARFGTARSTP